MLQACVREGHGADLCHAVLEHQVARVGTDDHDEDHEEGFQAEAVFGGHLLRLKLSHCGVGARKLIKGAVWVW